MTHDTDVLEPEPTRQGGLVRKDMVCCPFRVVFFVCKLVTDLVISNTPFANRKILTLLRRGYPLLVLIAWPLKSVPLLHRAEVMRSGHASIVREHNSKVSTPLLSS